MKTKGYMSTVSMLDKTKQEYKCFTEPHGCKDLITTKMARAIVPEYAKVRGWFKDENYRLKVTPRPGFVFFCNREYRTRTACKFQDMIWAVEDRLGIRQITAIDLPEVHGDWRAGPIVANTAKWWISSPIAVSFYFTLLRLAPYMQINEGFEDFIHRIILRGATAWLKKEPPDAKNIRRAWENENINMFLSKELTCLRRFDMADWLMHEPGRGIASYSEARDNHYPITRHRLQAIRMNEHHAAPGSEQGICR